MAPPARQVINEGFILDVIRILENTRGGITPLYDGTGPAAYQNLQTLSTWGGTDDYAPGKNLRDAILETGKGIETRLQQFDLSIEQFCDGLRELLADSDYIESLNSMSAEDFGRHVDVGGSPSSSSDTPPSTTDTPPSTNT